MNQLKPAKVNLRPRKIKSGISYQIDYRDPQTGKRIQRSVGMDKKKAELRRSEIEWKLFKGETGNIPQIVKESDLDSFFERFYDHCLKTRSVESVKKDNGRFKTLREFFKNKNIVSLNEITPGLVQELQSIYRQNHSEKGWNCLLSILKNILNRAVDWGVIDYNCIAKIKPLKVEKTFHYFTKDEIEQLILTAEEPLKTAIMILAHTGLRSKELYNLRWRNVDLKNRTITVKKHAGFSTKTKKLRSIPISDNLNKHLKTLKKSGTYICRPYKSPIRLWKKFKNLLKELEIEGTLYSLRHSFASHLVMAGVPLAVISEMMGHSSISTTMIYAHLSSEIHQSEIKKLPY